MVTTRSSSIHNFEDILESSGGFGRFQILMLVTILSLEIPAALVSFVPIFTGSLPEYWECNGIKINNSDVCTCNGTLSAPEPYTTVVGEWNLVCDLAWVSDLITSAQFVGMVVGVLFASQMADWYGRKSASIGSALLMGFGSAISAVAPNPYVYTVGRIICGSGIMAVLNVTGIYTLEMLTLKRRVLCGAAGLFGWGTALLGFIAYYVQPWRTLTWVSTAPALFLCPLVLLLVPESPRFLMRQGQFEEASAAINYIAKINGCPEIPIELVTSIAEKERGEVGKSSENRPSYFDLFRRSDLRLKTICLSAIWLAWGIVYFGVSFNFKNVPVDLYLSVVYMGLADIIGYPLTLVVIARCGRREAVVLTMSLAAVVMVTLAILQMFLDLTLFPFLVLALCTIGKSFLGMMRCAGKCFTGESFPTEIRTIGGGFCGLMNSAGAAISPQIVFIGTIVSFVPFLVFALVGSVGSAFSFFIPETCGKPLQDSIGRKLSRRLSVISSKFLEISSNSMKNIEVEIKS